MKRRPISREGWVREIRAIAVCLSPGATNLWRCLQAGARPGRVSGLSTYVAPIHRSGMQCSSVPLSSPEPINGNPNIAAVQVKCFQPVTQFPWCLVTVTVYVSIVTSRDARVRTTTAQVAIRGDARRRH